MHLLTGCSIRLHLVDPEPCSGATCERRKLKVKQLLDRGRCALTRSRDPGLGAQAGLSEAPPLPTHTGIVQQAGGAGKNCDPVHLAVDPLEECGATFHVATVIAHYVDCPDTPGEVVAQANGTALQFKCSCRASAAQAASLSEVGTPMMGPVSPTPL